MTKHSVAGDSCPCGVGRRYAECCGRWHAGRPATTAMELMRSRYVAFVLCDQSYLLATWHPRTRPATLEFEPRQKWLGLKVLEASERSDIAEVEFIARYRIGGGSAARLHERSRFVREAGLWLYVGGELRAT